jgi:hypothetical protein
MKTTCILLFIVLMFSGALFVYAQKPLRGRDNEVGYVESLHGNWVDHSRGTRVLAPFMPVWEDSSIRVDAADRDYFITVRIYGLADAKQFKCTSPTVCAGTLPLREALDRRNPSVLEDFQRVLAALRGVIVGAPPGGENFISRGAGPASSGPQDDLIVANAHDVTIDKLFALVPFGRYSTIFTHLWGKGSPVMASVEWGGGRQLSVILPPGLYRLHLTYEHENSGSMSQFQDCVVLAVKLNDYQRARSLIVDGNSYVSTWGDASPTDRQAILRYLMLALARKKVK